MIRSTFPAATRSSIFFNPSACHFTRSVRHRLADGRRPVGHTVSVNYKANTKTLLVTETRARTRILTISVGPGTLDFARIGTRLTNLGGIHYHSDGILGSISNRFSLVITGPPCVGSTGGHTCHRNNSTLNTSLSMHVIHRSVTHLSINNSLLLCANITVIGNRSPFLTTVHRYLSGRRLS